MNQKYPVNIRLFVSQEIDDKLDDMCELLGITKNEYIRFVLGNSLSSYNQVVDVLKDELKTRL